MSPFAKLNLVRRIFVSLSLLLFVVEVVEPSTEFVRSIPDDTGCVKCIEYVQASATKSKPSFSSSQDQTQDQGDHYLSDAVSHASDEFFLVTLKPFPAVFLTISFIEDFPREGFLSPIEHPPVTI